MLGYARVSSRGLEWFSHWPHPKQSWRVSIILFTNTAISTTLDDR